MEVPAAHLGLFDELMELCEQLCDFGVGRHLSACSVLAKRHGGVTDQTPGNKSTSFNRQGKVFDTIMTEAHC